MRRRRLLRGQSLTEFALILPILALIMIGAADLGRAYYTKVTLANAARVAAEYAVDPTRPATFSSPDYNFTGNYPDLTDPCTGSDSSTACGKKRAELVARNLVMLEAKNLGITLNDVAIFLVPSSANSKPFLTGAAAWTGDALTWTPNGKYAFSVRAKFVPLTPGISVLFGGTSPTFTHTVYLRHNCTSSTSCSWQ